MGWIGDSRTVVLVLFSMQGDHRYSKHRNKTPGENKQKTKKYPIFPHSSSFPQPTGRILVPIALDVHKALFFNWLA